MNFTLRGPLRSAIASVALLCAVFCSSFAAQAPYRVLLTNDDGVRAPGLQAMADALKAATYAQSTHPLNKRPYYWDTFVEGGKDAPETDTMRMQAGYATVTPLHVGEFDRATYDKLKTLIK